MGFYPEPVFRKKDTCFLNSGTLQLRGDVSGAVVSVQLQKSVCSLRLKNSRFCLPENLSGLARLRAMVLESDPLWSGKPCFP